MCAWEEDVGVWEQEGEDDERAERRQMMSPKAPTTRPEERPSRYILAQSRSFVFIRIENTADRHSNTAGCGKPRIPRTSTSRRRYTHSWSRWHGSRKRTPNFGISAALVPLRISNPLLRSRTTEEDRLSRIDTRISHQLFTGTYDQPERQRLSFALTVYYL